MAEQVSKADREQAQNEISHAMFLRNMHQGAAVETAVDALIAAGWRPAPAPADETARQATVEHVAEILHRVRVLLRHRLEDLRMVRAEDDEDATYSGPRVWEDAAGALANYLFDAGLLATSPEQRPNYDTRFDGLAIISDGTPEGQTRALVDSLKCAMAQRDTAESELAEARAEIERLTQVLDDVRKVLLVGGQSEAIRCRWAREVLDRAGLLAPVRKGNVQ